jgi:hypothetical protein
MKNFRFILPFLAVMFTAFSTVQLSAQTSCKGKSTALETLGMQGGALVYNTYEVVGSIHDGLVTDTWEKATAVSILDEQVGMMNKLEKQYQDLIDSKFLSDPDDSAFVMRMKKTTALVRKEAEDLETYINDKTDTNEATYQESRKAAWKEIAALLGIEE